MMPIEATMLGKAATLAKAMMPFFRWLQHSPVARAIQDSRTLISILETIHLLGLTVLAGTILMVDMTLLGAGIRNHPVARIGRELAPWTLGGLIVLLLSGPVILTSEAEKCYYASFFWIKMAALIAAVLFHFTVYRRAVSAEPPVSRPKARLVACVSLGLWIGVALAGKMIGIYGDDLRKTDDAFLQSRVIAVEAQPNHRRHV